MNTELKNAVKATDSKAQYDTSAKRLLGQKSILAHILVKTVDEFKGMNPKDVVDCIEGTPHISTVPVEPGLTNAASEKNGERLVGFNTENEEINEGLVRFDIVFYVRMRDGLSQIIINVEAQKDEPTGYEILNRAIFYVSRLISSQKERDFLNQPANQLLIVFCDVLRLLCEKLLHFTDSLFHTFTRCSLHLGILFCLTKHINLIYNDVVVSFGICYIQQFSLQFFQPCVNLVKGNTICSRKHRLYISLQNIVHSILLTKCHVNGSNHKVL